MTLWASMGPPSDKGGYANTTWGTACRAGASMGPPSDKGGYVFDPCRNDRGRLASMGPPSDKGGYGPLSETGNIAGIVSVPARGKQS